MKVLTYDQNAEGQFVNVEEYRCGEQIVVTVQPFLFQAPRFDATSARGAECARHKVADDVRHWITAEGKSH